MTKIKINEKEFDIESLSDEAKAKITSLRFVQNEISVLKARIAVYKNAEENYLKSLQEDLSDEG